MSPNNKVTFSMEDADLSELVRTIAQITGKRFIFGGKVRTIKASVYSPEKVTVAEAYQAFLSILETNGLTVVPHGRFLKIVEVAGIASQVTPTYAPGESAPAEDRFVTRMHRLNHVSADDVSAILSHFKTKEGDITTYAPGNLLIITDTGANIRRMMQIVEDIDVGNAGDQIWIEPIHYASASDVEKRINDLFDVKSSSSSSGGAKPAGDKKGGGGGEPAGGGGSVGSGDLHVSKIVADDRSNSLVIVATERAYLRVLEFIKRIDVPNTGEGEIHVFSLQHADATELTKTLNEIINGAGGGAAAGAAPAGGAPRPAAAGGGGAIAQGIFEGGVKVSADPATNSIVVTSSQRDYAALRNVVDRLDQARRQVFIEAVIMDLQLKRSDGLGVTFHAGDTFSAAGQSGGLIYGGNNPLNTISLLPTDPTALQGFALGVRGPGIPGSENLLGTGISIPAFGTFISAIASTGDTDLLSTPHILATDNIPAEISVGDNVPTQTNTGAGGGLGALAGLAGGAAGGAGALGGLGLGGFTAPRADVGTKIKIKPHLNDSNEVRLELSEEISEAGATLPGALGAVPIAKRTATTQLVVKDQQTVVIGGLIRSVNSRTEAKVPFLGDIPVLGALFRTRTDTIEKRNLILILTPYIIREQADLRTVFERKMEERQQYLDHYFVFSDNTDYEPPKDYSRANGLLENVRQAYINVEERRHLDDLTKPREVKTHTPGEPLEMPASVHSAAAASGGDGEGNAPAPPAVSPARERRNRETGAGENGGERGGERGGDGNGSNGAPSVNVNPPARSVDRQER